MKRYMDSTAMKPVARVVRKLARVYRASSMGGPTLPPPAPMEADAGVTDNGERVVPEDKSFCFQAHLSIYNFAKPYAYGKRVLDAGCGTGYGSHHLLTACGAKSVLGIDLSDKAIAYCQSRYIAENLRYEAMDLQQLTLSGRSQFDVIFSSNVLEHVADVDTFLKTACRLLTPDGVFVLAVPAVVTPEALEGNLENPYHINNITPPAWLTKMRRFFREAQGYRHWVEPEWVGPDLMVRWDNEIEVGNFIFTERDDDGMMKEWRTITTIIVARGPRPHPLPKTTDELGYPAEWNVDLGRPRGRPEGVVGPIHESREVVQTFVCDEDDLNQIEVMMATYARVNDSTLEVSLRRESAQGEVVAQSEYRTADMIDNDWLRLHFPPVANSRGTRFALVLRAPTARPDHSVTAYYTSALVPGRETLKVGRLDRPGNCLHMHVFGGK